MFSKASLMRIILTVGYLFTVSNGLFECATENRCVIMEYTNNGTQPDYDDVVSSKCGDECDNDFSCDNVTDCVDAIEDLIESGGDVSLATIEACTACIDEAVEYANSTGSECGDPEISADNTTLTVNVCLSPAFASAIQQKSCCGTDDICFSAVSNAFVESVGQKLVKDIQVGDKVLTGSGSFETVYTVDHQNPNKLVKFLQIYSTGGVAPLEVTPDHLVFLHGQKSPVPAKAIRVGDFLQAVNTASPGVVTKVSSVERKGIWNPITSDGTIAVEGIVASTYSAHFGSNDEGQVKMGGVNMMSHHDFAHFLLAPYRAICLGLSLSFCENKEEFNAYSQLGLHILNFFRVQNGHVQDMIVCVFVQVAFVFKFLSMALNPLAVTGLVLATGIYFLRKKN